MCHSRSDVMQGLRVSDPTFVMPWVFVSARLTWQTMKKQSHLTLQASFAVPIFAHKQQGEPFTEIDINSIRVKRSRRVTRSLLNLNINGPCGAAEGESVKVAKVT